MKMTRTVCGALVAVLLAGCSGSADSPIGGAVLESGAAALHGDGDPGDPGDPFGAGSLQPVRKGRADRYARMSWEDMARRAAMWPPEQPQDRHFKRKRPPAHKHPQPESAPFADALVGLVPDPLAGPTPMGGPGGPFGPADGVGGPPAPRPLSPAPLASFLGLADNNASIPPDTHGAVGPDHLMVTLNSQVRVQDRAGAELSIVRLDDFWDELGLDAFDPRVHYDHQEDRWIFVATADSGAASSAILIGASEGADPTGDWHLYAVDIDESDIVWADYPSVGFNRHWIVVDVNMFTIDGNNFSSGEVFVFDKADLYAGGEGSFTQLSVGGIGTASPAVVHDPAMDDLHLLVTWNGSFNGNGFLRLYTVTGAVGDEQIDSGPFAITPNPWSFSPPDGDEIGPQLDSDHLLMTNDSRMQKVVYRNGSLFAAQTVHLPAGGAATHAAVQWWQLDPHTVANNLMAVRQWGRVGSVDADAHFAFPAIAANRADDVLLGYTRMAPDQYASANYSFRLGGDEVSTMQADSVLKAGEAPYFKTLGGETNRWGDYSAAMVDPTDDLSLWTLQMYAAGRSNDIDRWGVWWGQVRPPLRPPVIAPMDDVQVDEGELLALSIPASDANADPLTYTVDALPQGATLDADTGDFSWIPGYDQAGEYPLTFTASDGDGEDDESLVITVVDANEPPHLDPIGDREVGEREVLAFRLTATDNDGDPITFGMDPAPEGAFLGPVDGRFSWTPTRAQIGAHVVEFSASDGDKVGVEEVTITVLDDNRPPVLDAIGDRAVDEGQALVIALSGSDPEGDPLTFSADDVPQGATLDADTGVFRWVPGFDQAGDHVVTFRIHDVALDDSETVTLAVRHVNQAPVLTPVGPKAGAEMASLEFTLDADDIDGDPLTFGAQDLPAGATLNSDSGQFRWTPGFSQAGVHPVTFSVSDGALDDSERVNLTIENVNRGPLLGFIDRRAMQEGERVEIPLVFSDPDGDPVDVQLVEAPRGARIDLEARLLIWQPGFDQAGLHRFELVATDGDLERRRSFTIDVGNVNQAPTVEVQGPRIGHEAEELALDIVGDDPDGDPVFLAAPLIPVGATFDSPSGQFRWTPTYDQEGEHDARFVVSDGARVEGVDVVLTILNTNRRPVPLPVVSQQVDEDQPLALSLQATDPDGDDVSWSLRAPPAGATLSPQGALAWRPNFQQAGRHVLLALASDGADAGELPIEVTVANVNRRPALDPPGALRVREGELLAVELTASDPDGQVLSFSADGLPAGATVGRDTGALRWTPGFDDSGSHPITVRVSDGELADTLDVAIDVIHVNRRPTIESPGPRQGHEDQLISVDVSATDPDGDSLVFTAQGLPVGARMDVDTGQLRWTPNFDQAGEYRVTLRVHDGGLSAETTTEWRILDVNRLPTLQPVADQLGAEGELLALDLTASDPDGDVIRYLSEDLPAGATLDRDTGELRWTPGFDQARAYVVRLIASDGKGGDDVAQVRLDIADVDQPPVVGELPDRRAREGELLEVDVTASDPDHEPVALAASQLPAGAVFDEASGQLSWTPGFDQAGEHDATFVATARGLTGQGRLRIIVDNVDRPPVAEPIEAQVVREGELLTTAIAVSDPDGDAVALSALSLPDGAELDDEAKEVRWKPGFEDSGEHRAAVTLSDGELDGRLEWLITVVDVNRPPSLEDPGDLSGKVGEELSLLLVGDDPDGNTLSYSVVGLPPGAKLESLSGRFFWVPTVAEAGEHEGTFVVTDGEFEREVSVLASIALGNRPPTLQRVEDREVTVDEELTIAIRASDPDGDALSVKLDSRPGGLLLDMGALTIRWTPAEPQIGEHALKLTVSDGQAEASAEFSVRVLPAPAAPAAEGDGGLDPAGRLAAPPAKGSGCSAAGPAGGGAPPIWALLLLGLLAQRRRKRR